MVLPDAARCRRAAGLRWSGLRVRGAARRKDAKTLMLHRFGQNAAMPGPFRTTRYSRPDGPEIEPRSLLAVAGVMGRRTGSLGQTADADISRCRPSPPPGGTGPTSNSRRGALNDVVVTTTRTRRHGCHNDVVAAEPRLPLSIIRLTGSGSGPQLADPMGHGRVSSGE